MQGIKCRLMLKAVGLFESSFRILRTTLGRCASGISALLGLAWLLWPTRIWSLKPDALAAFISALIIWILSQTPEKSISRSDQDLFRLFTNLIAERELRFLRERDLGHSFLWSYLENLDTFAANWKGVNYEFDNRRLYLKFEKIKVQTINFLTLVSDETEMHRGRCYVIPREEGDMRWSSEKKWRVHALNEASSTLHAGLSEFIKYARKIIHSTGDI